MKLKKLIEKRNELAEQMKEISENAIEEERAFSEDENQKYNQIRTEASKLNQTIETIEQDSNLLFHDNKFTGEVEVSKENNIKPEERAFINYIENKEELRADFNLTKADNGAVIPTSIINRIIKEIEDKCPIFNMAEKFRSKGTIQIPYYDNRTSRITANYAEEFTELESTSGNFKSIELRGYLAGVLSLISKSLINNSNFNILNFVVKEVSNEIYRWIERELIFGTNNKITGLRNVNLVNQLILANKLSTDDLIALQDEIIDDYQKNSVWIMNRRTRNTIRKFKDNDGNYILNRDLTAKWGYSLLGKDIYTTDTLPAIGETSSDEPIILYGDFSGLAVNIHEEPKIEVLREKYSTRHAIGIVSWLEMDAKVINTQKIAKLINKAKA